MSISLLLYPSWFLESLVIVYKYVAIKRCWTVSVVLSQPPAIALRDENFQGSSTDVYKTPHFGTEGFFLSAQSNLIYIASFRIIIVSRCFHVLHVWSLKNGQDSLLFLCVFINIPCCCWPYLREILKKQDIFYFLSAKLVILMSNLATIAVLELSERWNTSNPTSSIFTQNDIKTSLIYLKFSRAVGAFNVA